MSKATITEALQSAIAHHQAGRLPEAEALYREILARDPRCADALHLLGVAALQVGRHELAVDLIRQAVKFSPKRAHFHSNLGEAYRGLARFDEAIASLRRALTLQPDFPAALNSLGVVLGAQHQTDEAFICYQKAIQRDPNYADAHHNLGVVFSQRGEWEKAEACFHRALVLRPNAADTHTSLGNVFKKRGQLDEAIAAYQQAIAIKPNSPEAHNNLGEVFKDQGRLDAAIDAYRRALRHDRPDIHSNIVLTLHYRSGDEVGMIAGEFHRWNQQHAVPLAALILPHTQNRSPGRRLRIGYVSPDLCDHVIGYNLLPLFERHNHRDFEIFGYAQVSTPDAITERLRACCDHWRNISDMTDVQLVAQVRRDEIDILVDLALHLAKNRLPVFARKPAPVQVSFAGYPGGSGVQAIDYHLTDRFLEPPNPDHAIGPDAPCYLPASFWCYEGLAVDLPVGPLPAVSGGRVTFGCLNNFCKFNVRTLELWTRVVVGVPGSRLLLLAPKGSARERTLNLFAQAGLAADRIEFAERQPRERYLALYHRIDVGLDTFPYNGHSTSLDSYWMGVPVVTLVGSTPVSRAGWSQLSNLGLTELAAATPEDFVRLASALARDLPRLAALRAGLRERMRRSPLMDGAQFTRGIESAYRTMWQQWCVTADRERGKM
jgi:protein O-GlcNAc transferase